MRLFGDMRGVLALFVLAFTAVYAFALLFVAGAQADVPDWMTGLAFTVAAYYFGFRDATTKHEAVASLVAELERRAGNGHDITEFG